MIKHTFVMIFFLGLFAVLSSPAFAEPIGSTMMDWQHKQLFHPGKYQKKAE